MSNGQRGTDREAYPSEASGNCPKGRGHTPPLLPFSSSISQYHICNYTVLSKIVFKIYNETGKMGALSVMDLKCFELQNRR